MKITILLFIFSLSGICCKAYLEDLTTIQTVRMSKVLKSKGFSVTKDSKESDIQVVIKKKNYFNIYGYPHFFMRKIRLNIIFDQVSIFSTYSSDGFPVYKAYSDVLKDLRSSTFSCVNSQIIR